MTQVELAELIARLRSYLNGGPDACLKGTPMIPLHRNTVAEIVDALERALPISCEDEVKAMKMPSLEEEDVIWLRDYARGHPMLAGRLERIARALEARIPQEDGLREALKDARRYIANCWIDPVATEEERALVAKIDAALEGRSGE